MNASEQVHIDQPQVLQDLRQDPSYLSLLRAYGSRFVEIIVAGVLVNLLGLLPGSFSPTSHIAVTAVLAMMVFLTVTLVGFYKKGIGFLGMFWVSSAPLPLRPILALIELISYFVRPLSHSIRLGGNIMAGHAVIKVFAGFAGVMGIASVVPIAAIAAIYGLELLVAVVQAYVFTILTCVYLRDAVGEAHH
jgi:F-type H+-transporting ATPase subunit a